MLKKYRSRFVWLNLLFVGFVLLVMLSAVGVYMYHDYYTSLESTMSEVLKPVESTVNAMLRQNMSLWDLFPSDTSREEPSRSAISEAEAQDIYTFYYDTEDGLILVLSNTLPYDEDTLLSAVRAISTSESRFGTLTSENLIYYCEPGEGCYKIALTDADYIREPMLRLVLILCGTFAAAMTVFWFISRYISGLAVRPLEQAMARERQFVADVSHDLKTPLTVILANSSILRENPDATVGEQMKWLDNTQAAAENMQKLVSEMLTLSQSENPNSTLPLEETDISAAAERASLQLESVAFDAGIALETRIPEQLTALANREALERVICSLIENALKYEPVGGTIYFSAEEDRNHVTLTVRNPGSVIPAADLPHVFERFYRADKTRGSHEGHGLGLAIAKSTVEQMGGSIAVESYGGLGTVFTISLKKA